MNDTPITAERLLELNLKALSMVPYRVATGYVRLRIEALKPMPLNQWLRAAEDILVESYLRVEPDTERTRARRIVSKVAPQFVVPLREWKEGTP